MIDLDHNATTPLDARVRAAMIELMARGNIGNPSSTHAGGRIAREVVEAARAEVAGALGAAPLGVTFTSGGTEADALAILGGARALRAQQRAAGVLSSPIEHPAVLGAVQRLAAEGHPVAWVHVDGRGRIDPAHVAAVLAADASLGLVSLAAANHELGNSYDVAAVVEEVRRVRPEVVVHVDAVQAFGKVAVDFDVWQADLVSVSAHKIGGPAGVGALVHRPHARLAALWGGGGQERGRRPGTEAVWSVHGFGRAARLAADERAERYPRVLALRTRLAAGLAMLGAEIHGDAQHHVGNTVHAAFAGCEGQLVAIALDLLGTRISTGAACSSGTVEPSPVMLALGLDRVRAAESLRFSLGSGNTVADVDAVLDQLPPVLARIREASAPTPSFSGTEVRAS